MPKVTQSRQPIAEFIAMDVGVHSMTSELIQEYRDLALVCSETDYSDSSSVKRNNQAVDKMYEIVTSIVSVESVVEFSQLLDETNNNVNRWAAIHMLEKLKLDRKTERKALKIIISYSKGNSADAMGFKSWLEEFSSRKR